MYLKGYRLKMNGPTESQTQSCRKNILRELCAYKLKSDYNLKLALKKDGDNGSMCSHTMSGSSEHNIVKLAAVVAAITVSVCAISSVCSLLSGFSKR